MKEKIAELLKDKLIKWMAITFIFIMLIFLITLVWKWSQLPPQLPLYYSHPRGQEQLGTPIHILLLPFFSLILFTINFIISSYLYSQERLAAFLLLVAGVTSSFLLLVTFLKIVFLVS